MNNLIKILAEAVQDAGCQHYANYPGFHANELHAALGASVTSTDEKNAFAYAWGCSMMGESALVTFKNVGLNDAADAFLGAHFTGCRGGLVLILFDDCDIQHSQTRIDVRPYFSIYGGLWLEPRHLADAYEQTKNAFEYSERFQIPVVVRITNILYDMGMTTAVMPEIHRSKAERSMFPELERRSDSSPYVVHPSEAWRMERNLIAKKSDIADFVETLYDDAAYSTDIVMGAKRNIRVKKPLRLFTLPLPQKKIQALFSKVDREVLHVYEHGPTPFIKQQIDQILSAPGCQYHNMEPDSNLHPKYHNHTYMEKLFSGIRDVTGAIVCGDLGNFTMDPGRTLHLCLCYGVSVAVAMGVADTNRGKRKTFCITGDAAYLHSGQQCLYEMVERKVDVTVFVLENGGALGTGGQHIPGNLSNHPEEVRVFELDYGSMSEKDLHGFVSDLPEQGVNLVIVHTHEEKQK